MILTFNEQDNLRRTLEAIKWAKRILIVDSFSTDGTLQIASEYPQVQVVQNRFEHFADQCNFGLSFIRTEWVLSLDADYVCSEELFEELAGLDSSYVGYWVKFKYGIYGKPLRSSLYPPRVVLYRKRDAGYLRDGHAHRVALSGSLGCLNSQILHDDWKPLFHWFRSQLKYAEHEADKLMGDQVEGLDWKDRLRTWIVVAPVLTVIYCLFLKRLMFDGRAGLLYTLQRTLAELVLSVTILDKKLRKKRRVSETALVTDALRDVGVK